MAVESERMMLIWDRDAAAEIRVKAETQVLAIDRLLTRYPPAFSARRPPVRCNNERTSMA